MENLFGEVHANCISINLLNFKNGQYARFVVGIIEAILDLLFAKCNFLTVTDMYTRELGVFMYRFSISSLYRELSKSILQNVLKSTTIQPDTLMT